MSFAIVTDTSANLPLALVNDRGIAVVPFTYIALGRERSTTDIARFDGARYYEAMRKGMAVRTSLISPKRYADFFRPLLERGEDLVYVGMSSGISSSFQCAVMAAEELREAFPGREIYTVDALGASLGEGLLALRAADLREAGRSAGETAAALEALRRRMCQVFTVDDLLYLRRGGRLSSMAAIVGTALQIKPILKGDENGRIVVCGKTRGRRRAVEFLAERYGALVEDPGSQVVGIAQAGCPQDAVALAQLLREKATPRDILTVCYEPVTGSHVGPGALALFFFGGEDVRTVA